MPTLRWSFLGRLPSVARKYAKYHRLGTEPERSRNTKNGDGGRTAGPRTKSRTWLTKKRWATSPTMFPPAGDGPRPRPLLSLDYGDKHTTTTILARSDYTIRASAPK
ncbi:hypothetical protein EAG_07597 [Camponotus floridanus]|uniref:Uncharacterized protein n=1 Tax=Camponotus floridanus TaxID=104421 RepID=E2A5S0_CAMFO|nr:hypothetical protein EAG_07597 [Camponotus floridanus]